MTAGPFACLCIGHHTGSDILRTYSFLHRRLQMKSKSYTCIHAKFSCLSIWALRLSHCAGFLPFPELKIRGTQTVFTLHSCHTFGKLLRTHPHIRLSSCPTVCPTIMARRSFLLSMPYSASTAPASSDRLKEQDGAVNSNTSFRREHCQLSEDGSGSEVWPEHVFAEGR
jgi:hypothetical protein